MAWKRLKITCANCLLQFIPEIQLQAQGSHLKPPGTGRAPSSASAPSSTHHSKLILMGLRDGHTSVRTLSYQSKTYPGHPAMLDRAGREKQSWEKIPNPRPGAKKCNKNHGNTQKCTAPGREAGSAAGQGKVLSNKPSVGGRGTPPGASVLENPRMPRIWADKTQEGWGVPSTVRAGDGGRSFQVQPRTCRQQREQSLPIPRFPALPGAAGSIPSQHIHGKHKEQEPP